MPEFVKLVLLPTLLIAAVAYMAMLICYRNPKWRHLVGPDPEMKKGKGRNLVGIGFDFPEDGLKEVDELRSRLGLEERGEVINHSLGALKWVTGQIEEGNTILLERNDGTTAEISFPEIEAMMKKPRALPFWRAWFARLRK